MRDRHRRPRVPGVVALALACAAVGGCRRPEPIRVGFVGGLTGRHYGLGVSCRNGAQLAVDELNAAGGIRGRRVELLVRDDAHDPDQAQRAVRELIRAGVVAIVGPPTSAMAQAVLPIADAEHVLLVSPTASSPALAGLDDWLVLLDASAASTAQAMAKHVLGARPGLAVSIVYDLSNLPYTVAWRDNFGEALASGGGRLVTLVSFASGNAGSFGDLAEAALAARPDAVLLVANALDTAMLAQQVRKRDRRVQLLGTGWSFTADVLEHGGAALEGALFPLKVNPEDPSPPAARFRKAFTDRFGHLPDFAAIEAYESVQGLATALARDATREGVRREMLRLGTFPGVTGSIRIDRFGDAHREDRMSTVRNGRFVPLE